MIDPASWEPKDGLIRNMMIGQAQLHQAQFEAFFVAWNRDHEQAWAVLQKFGMPPAQIEQLQFSWSRVRRTARTVYHNLTTIPEPEGWFLWGLIVRAEVDIWQMVIALKIRKREAEAGRSISPLQVLLVNGQLPAERFTALIAEMGQAVQGCRDCGCWNWLPQFDPQHTYICEGCAGELEALPEPLDVSVVQLVGHDALGQQEVGGHVLGALMASDDTGALHLDASQSDTWVKLLELGALSPDAARRHKREILDLKSLTDPHLIRPVKLDTDEDQALLTFAMPCPGRVLGRIDDAWGEKRVLRLLRDVARGLAVLHRSGLTHGAIRPAAVWIPDDHTECDVTGALLFCGESLLPHPGGLPGRAYQPASGAGTQMADIYGLGLLMAQLATGEAAPPTDHPALIEKLPPGLAKIVTACLIPGDCYERVPELLGDLRELVGSAGTRPRSKTNRTTRKRAPSSGGFEISAGGTRRRSARREPADPGSDKRKKLLIGGALVVVALLCGGLLIAKLGGGDHTEAGGGTTRVTLKGTTSGTTKVAPTDKMEAARKLLLAGKLDEARAAIEVAGPGSLRVTRWESALEPLGAGDLARLYRKTGDSEPLLGTAHVIAAQLLRRSPDKAQQLADELVRAYDGQDDASTPESRYRLSARIAHLQPRTPEARTRVARDAMASGRYKEAASALADAVEAEPGNRELALLQAIAASELGDRDTAVNSLDALIAELERDMQTHQALGLLARVRIRRGFANLMGGEADAARTDFETVTRQTRRIGSHSDPVFRPDDVSIAFEADPAGRPLRPGMDLATTYVSQGVKLATSIPGAIVSVNGYNVGGKSGGQSCATHQPLYRGTLSITFCLPGKPGSAAVVTRVGLWCAQVSPNGTALEAYDSAGRRVAVAATRRSGNDFLGVECPGGIAMIKVVPNEAIDPDYAIDDLTFDRPATANTDPFVRLAQLGAALAEAGSGGGDPARIAALLVGPTTTAPYGAYASAARIAKQLVELAPRSASAWAEAARIHIRLGRRTAALGAIDRGRAVAASPAQRAALGALADQARALPE